MRFWIIMLLIGAGCAWGVARWRPWNQLNSGNTAASNRLKTVVVERRTIDFSITAAGDIGPAEQVSVRPEINGRIATLPVDLGDKVKQGAILFTLDDKDLQTERESRLTEIERAQLQLEKANRGYNRSKELFEENLISQELFEDTKTEFELAKNSLDRAQKELHLLEDRLTKTKIVAPFDCTVLTRPISVGQAVSGSGGFNSGTEILTIADLNEMVVNAHINQADITRLTAGQEVAVQVESVPGLRLNGMVDRIAPQTTLKNNVKGYGARILIKNLDSRVLPGMTASLNIPVASASNAVALPLAAVVFEQGERFAFVEKAGKAEKRAILVGVYDYDYAEVLSGVEAGEEVWIEPPPEQLANSAKSDGSGTNGGASGSVRGGSAAASPGKPRPPVAAGSPPSGVRPRSELPAPKARPS